MICICLFSIRIGIDFLCFCFVFSSEQHANEARQCERPLILAIGVCMIRRVVCKEIKSITNDELERASCASTIDRISNANLSFSSNIFFRRKLLLFHVSSVPLGGISLQICVFIFAFGDSKHHIGSERKPFAALLDNSTSKRKWFMGFYPECQTTFLGRTHLSLIRNV